MSDKVEVNADGQITTVSFNRPEAYNAFDLETVEQLSDCLTAIAMDDNVRAIVITGKGKSFCAGGDLKWALGFEGGLPAAFHTLAGRFHSAVVEIRRMKKPVIAAVNGVAAGAGFTVALASDFRVIAKSATMRQAYTSSGLCVDGGGTFTLPRLVGLARALEIVAFDKPITSEQAEKWGLATKVVDDGAALDEALNMARELANKSLHSFGLSKQLLTDSFDTSFEVQLENERAGLCACAAHNDGKEGIQAFSEKRKPNFN